MKCYYCGSVLGRSSKCPACNTDVRDYKRLVATSNLHYNHGLEKARVRDLSGAVDSLRQSLFYFKGNVEARNLLGLIYFELGEVVLALSEWVISRSFQPEGNPAEEYLNRIQNDKEFLDRANERIKQYNQALQYARQGSTDLAILQLKKVSGQKPTLLKAEQLLGLLYMNSGEYEKARSVLRKALRVDGNNTQTQLYFREVLQILSEKGGRKRKKQNDAFAYQSGNETIIQPILNAKNTLTMLANVAIGVLAGAALVYFLVFPAMRSSILSANTELARTANEQLASKEALLKSYENQIEELQNEVTQLKNSQNSDDAVTEQYATLLLAYQAFREENTDEAQKLYLSLDKTVFDETTLEIYNELADALNPEIMLDYYENAQAANEAQDYDTSILYYEKMLALDDGYLNGGLLFEAAEAYSRKGRRDDALDCYMKVTSDFPETTYASTAQERIDEMMD